MDKIKRIWILLSPDAVSFCHESPQTENLETDIMSYELFSKITDYAIEQSLSSIVLGTKNGIPARYQALCDKMKASIILPADFNGALSCEHTTIVFNSNQVELAPKHRTIPKVILRVFRQHLGHLSDIISELKHYSTDISVKHPELLLYNEKDMAIYKDQLLKISKQLLEEKEHWHRYRIDRLTDTFRSNVKNECGAGVTSIAIAHDGKLYLCPAAKFNGEPTCGLIFENFELPNAHLLTREYSVPCEKCNALHCYRCVHLNKLGTFEVCVPPKNICWLAHIELEMQAMLAEEAISKNLWDKNYFVPKFPNTYDPYEAVRAEADTTFAVNDVWRHLVRFTGRPEDLQPHLMLNIIHGLYGWCQALEICMSAGRAPSYELINKDVLASLRRRTIETYRDVVFQENCPTVGQIESLMCAIAQRNNSS